MFGYAKVRRRVMWLGFGKVVSCACDGDVLFDSVLPWYGGGLFGACDGIVSHGNVNNRTPNQKRIMGA